MFHNLESNKELDMDPKTYILLESMLYGSTSVESVSCHAKALCALDSSTPPHTSAPLCSQHVDVSEVLETCCCMRGLRFPLIQPCSIGQEGGLQENSLQQWEWKYVFRNIVNILWRYLFIRAAVKNLCTGFPSPSPWRWKRKGIESSRLLCTTLVRDSPIVIPRPVNVVASSCFSLSPVNTHRIHTEASDNMIVTFLCHFFPTLIINTLKWSRHLQYVSKVSHSLSQRLK